MTMGYNSNSVAPGTTGWLRRKVGSGGAPQLLRKVWARLRFRLLAFTRPGTTLRRHRALKGKTVVVYTMGKVASSSVFYTLMQTFPFRRIYHNHFLSKSWLEDRLPGTPFTRNIKLAKATLRAIDDPSHEILYICMMRDPIARDLSNVIQNYVENDIDIIGKPLDDVMARLQDDGHMFFQDWFDTDFAGHIGSGLETFPFDPAKGFSIHRIDHRRSLLFLTVETVDRVFDAALADFLGVDIDPQFRFNESNDKTEAEFYARLKQSYRLSAAELDRVYGAQACRHFYDDAQIAAFMAKWGNE